MHLAARSSASSGWVPATILAIATADRGGGLWRVDRRGRDLRRLCRLRHRAARPALGPLPSRPGRLHRRGRRARPVRRLRDRDRDVPRRPGAGGAAAVPRLAARDAGRVHGRARPAIALARERHPRTGRLVVVAGGDPRDPARLHRRDLLRAAPPDRHGCAVRGHGVSPRPDRRAAAPRPADDPVRHRRPARLPLVLLCRGRGDELGDRHRAHRAALPPVRRCRCSRHSWS